MPMDSGDHDGIVANVPGVGVFTPSSRRSLPWFEYGGRVGFSLSPVFRIDFFADGESGNDIGTKIHAGAALNLKF